MLKTQILEKISEIKDEISQKLCTYVHTPLNSHKKSDGSILTEMDLFISELFEEKFSDLIKGLSFYSEENQKSFNYPVLIVDPIDGTKEFAAGLDQCAVSFGIYFSEDFSDPRNFSWIYNFKNGFEISSDETFSEVNKNEELLGLVSNTEYDMGLYKESNVKPIGSIAYKLGLLAKGECDFVLTKRPKNIWDIAAGTHICKKNKINLYSSYPENFIINKEVYESPMLWCREEHLKRLQALFNLEK